MIALRRKRIGLGLIILILMFGLSACSAGKSGQEPVKTSLPGNKEIVKTDPGASTGMGQARSQEQLDQEERVLMYLEQTVPEVRKFRQNMESYNQGSNTKYHFIMRIDSGPDPQSSDTLTRDYYYIYVGSDMGSHTSRWNRFYVEKDLSAVLVENLTGGRPLSVEEWRQLQFTPPTNEN